MVSKNTVIGLGKSLTTNEVNGLISGTTIGQENNPNFSAKLIRILGAVGINSDLTLTNPGSDFATGTPTYTDVPLVSVTGRGSSQGNYRCWIWCSNFCYCFCWWYWIFCW